MQNCVRARLTCSGSKEFTSLISGISCDTLRLSNECGSAGFSILFSVANMYVGDLHSELRSDISFLITVQDAHVLQDDLDGL